MVVLHPNKSIPRAFECDAIFNSETELYLLKNQKEQHFSDALLRDSKLPDEVCPLSFYSFLFSLIFYFFSGFYESRNYKFQEHNLYFLQRTHLAVHLLLNILHSFPLS